MLNLDPFRTLLIVCFAVFVSACVSSGGKTNDTQLERSASLISWIADRYSPPWPAFSDAEKFYYPVALARVHLYGGNDPAVNFGDGESDRPPLRYGILDYRGQNPKGGEALPPFVGKEPFHFIYLGMSRLLMEARSAPAMMQNREGFLRAGLARKDNHSALYAEGTENHISMARTAGYIYAAEAAKEPELFPEAAGLKAELREWMLRWARELYQTGDAEWNSTIYTAYNLAGWLNVYDYSSPRFEDDPDLHDVARAVLDYYALQLALYFDRGQLGGAEMRGLSRSAAYERPSATTPYVAWLWFGYPDGGMPVFEGNAPANAVYAALSGYRPPAAIRKLAHGKFRKGGYYRFGSPGYLMNRLGETQRKLYIGRDFSLGSATMPVGGWTTANWQIINWKLIAGEDDGAPLMLWGNSGYRSLSSASGRNPWHQFAQHGNVLVQMGYVPADAESIVADARARVEAWQTAWRSDFITRFPDPDLGGHGPKGPVKWSPGQLENAVRSRVYYPKEAVDPLLDTGVVFLDLGSARVALRSLHNRAPDLSEAGVVEDRGGEQALFGLLLEVSAAEDYADMAAFMQAVHEQTRLQVDPNGLVEYWNLDGVQIRFEYARAGSYLEPEYDMAYGVREKRAFIQDADWRQPDWPVGEGHGRVPRTYVNGELIEPLPAGHLIDGPQVDFSEGRMSVRVGDWAYEVDYSGEQPSTRAW